MATFCLADLIHRLPLFIARYVEEQETSKGKFYGTFDLGRVYDLRCFEGID